MLISLAIRNVLRQKARMAITVATIATGVAALIVSGGFIADTFWQLGEAVIHSQLGHAQIARQGYFSRGGRSPLDYLINQPDELVAQVRKYPEVTQIMQRVNFSGLLNNGHSDLAVIGEGIEPEKETQLGSHITVVEGRHLAPGDQYGAMIGNGVARAMKLRSGDRATLVVNTLEGALSTISIEIVGIFQTISKDYDARAVRVALPAAHELLGTRGVNVLVVSLKNTADTAQLARRMERLSRTYEARTWDQLSDFYSKTVGLYETQFGALRLIVLMMVMLGVMNTINMSIFERQSEFATMRALGSYESTVFRLIVLETAVVSCVGTVLGVALGAGIAAGLSKVGIPMPPPPNADIGYVARIQLIPMGIAIAAAVGIASPLFATLVPAMRVSRMALALGLRRGI